MRAGVLVASLLLMALPSGVAAAAEDGQCPDGIRLPLIGTPYSLRLPADFTITELYGLWADYPIDVAVSAGATEPLALAIIDAAVNRPTEYLWYKARSWAGKLPQFEVVEQGDTRILLYQQPTMFNGGPSSLWTAVRFDHPETSILIEQHVGHARFDRNGILDVLATLRPSREGAVGTGVYVGGLFIATKPPFTWSSVRADESGAKGAQIVALIPGNAGFSLHLEFRASPWTSHGEGFERMLLSMADAEARLQEDPSVEDIARTTLAGIDALRMYVTYGPQWGRGGLIEYITTSGDYPIVLTVGGDARNLTPEVVAAIDSIAQSVRPQTQIELEPNHECTPAADGVGLLPGA